MLQEAFSDTDGFVRLWAYEGEETRAWAWKEDKGLADPLLVDPDQSLTFDWFIGHEDGAYSSYPRHFVVDREGVVAYVGITPSPDALREAIEQALAE